jgi:hypothetical protein
MLDTGKLVLRGKFINLSVHVEKERVKEECLNYPL